MRAFEFNAAEHRYTWLDNGQEIPSVTRIIERAGLSDLSAIPAAVLKNAADRGTNIHTATELYDTGTLATIDPAHEPYLTAWKMFRAAYRLDFEPREIELKLVSEKYNFAGTLDRYKIREGKLWICDIKTGSKVYKTTGLQLAAYEILLKENLPELAQLTTERSAVQLKKTGQFKQHDFNEDYHRARFIKCLAGQLTPEEITQWKA